MSNEVFFKPSLNIDSVFGDEFFEDNERFLLFLKAYYEWLQTTKITIVNKTGTFSRGEQIVGTTSKATAIIKEVKTDSLIVQLNTKKPFSKSETITGQTSSATGTIYELKDNVVRASGNIVNYRTLENSIDKYFAYLKDELYTSLPIDFYGNKPLVASKFKDFFVSKSNEQSYRFLFKLLYNEEIDFYYPGDDVIRVSDGNFEKTQIIRVTSTGFGTDVGGSQYERNIFDFLSKTIRGKTSGSFGFVVDIKKFFIGSIETAEMTLRLVSAEFQEGEEIVDVDDEDLNATIYGIVARFTINDGGSGYQVGDVISINGDGSDAQAVVSSIKQSPITSLKVNTVGHGYRLGTTATINNSGTGGSGLIIRVTDIANTYTVTNANTGNTYTVGEVSEVSIVNRGSGYFAAPNITIVDTTIESLGLLSSKLVTISNAGTNYAVGDPLVITANTGANAVGQVASVTANASFSNNLVFEDGLSLLFEQSYDDVLKTEDWGVGSFGPIRRIEFTNFGNGYSDEYPPTITVNSATGSNAALTVIGIQGMSANVEVDTANNVTGIGSIRAVEVSNFGINYTTATADASGSGDGNANLTPIISGIGISDGRWLDDDGKVSYKILQDSYYYQDYSYVIKSGLTVEKYIDTIKRSIHPAGLQVFGEILLIDTFSVASEFKSSIETIRDFIVRIYDFVTVAPTFGEFNISLEATIESFTALQVALIPNTDIASQEYVLQIVAGGDDTTNVMDNSVFSQREIVVIVPNEFSTEMEVEVAPIKKLIVTYTQTFDAYSEQLYGDLVMLPYANADISDFSVRTFGERFGNIPYKFGEYVIQVVPGGDDIVNIIDNTLLSDREILIKYEKEIISSLIEFNNEYDIHLELSPLDSIASSHEEHIISFPITEILYPEYQAISSYKYLLEIFVDDAVSIIFNDVTLAETGTEEIVIDRITLVNVDAASAGVEYNVEIIPSILELTVQKNQEYSVIVESIGLANVDFTDVFFKEYQVKPEIDRYANYRYEELFVSVLSDEEISLFASETLGDNYETIPTKLTVDKYQSITGTVNSAVDSYDNIFLSSYANTQIEVIDHLSISANASVVVGTSTNFTTDFDINDKFIANNELFMVETIANTEYMVVDRFPTTPYSNILAYKQI